MNPFAKAVQAKRKLKELYPELEVTISLGPNGLRLEVEYSGKIPDDLPEEIDEIKVCLT
jgi:hypothetical protein